MDNNEFLNTTPESNPGKEKKKDKSYYLEIKTFVLQKTPLRKRRSKKQIGNKYLKIVYLIENLY